MPTAIASTDVKTADDPEVAAMEAELTKLDRHGYLFGKKLAASYSPDLHAVIYRNLNLRWAQFRLDSDDIASFLERTRHPRFYGSHVLSSPCIPREASVSLLSYQDHL